jgi:hypothetical protein
VDSIQSDRVKEVLVGVSQQSKRLSSIESKHYNSTDDLHKSFCSYDTNSEKLPNVISTIEHKQTGAFKITMEKRKDSEESSFIPSKKIKSSEESSFIPDSLSISRDTTQQKLFNNTAAKPLLKELNYHSNAAAKPILKGAKVINVVPRSRNMG